MPNTDHQQTFVNTFLANENTPEKFWGALAQQPGFNDPKTVAGVQSVLQLNLLTHYQPALTTLLYQEQQQNPSLKDMRGFAAFSFDDWHTHITKLVTSGDLKTFPDGIEGKTPEENALNYADSMTQLVINLYPTSVFANQLSKDASTAFKESKPDLVTFFANNVDYDLKNNHINKLFDAANLNGVTDKTLLKKELISINRLSKLTDDYSQVSALRLGGIDSATALVSRYTPAQFAEKFSATVPAETAAVIYKKAEQIDNRATVLAMSVKMRNDIPIYAINGPANDAPPDYASLFGDTNCDCEQCQSVYGPSAYFVDCLNTLKKYSPAAFAKLAGDPQLNIIGRRPDLTQILLTCKNTNTPLPYIDLVNEVLENTLAPIPPVIVDGKPTYPQFQTTNTAEELLAYPEHVDTAAYDLLKTATSSFDLPLNLPLDETRLYLDKLGVKRYELMELYFGKQPHSKYADLSIATEFLQLSQTELGIVNGTTAMPVNLGKVTDFLKDTGLSYIEMLQLLECYLVNPLVNGERSIKVVSMTTDQTSCHIADLTLQTSTPTSLKVMPFIRLWKKTGWDMFDLDRAFTGLGVIDFTGDVNTKLIIPLSHIGRLKAMFNLHIQNIVSLWSNIDTHVYVDHAAEGQPTLPTQFAGLFQNKQVTNPIDPAFSDPGGLSGPLADKAGTILAALNLSQKDFDTLNQNRFVDGKLSLDDLSVLFRYAMLARALKLSIDDLISALDLTGLIPLGNSLHSADTLTFVDKLAFIRSFGFSIPELNGLLVKSATVAQPGGLNDIAKVLAAIRDGLKKIELLDAVGDTPQEQAKNKQQNQNNFICETLGAAHKTEAKVIDVLINGLLKSVADNTQPAITPFIDAGFIASDGPLYKVDASNAITWTFPDLFNTYVLLGETWSRISRLVAKLKISNDEFIYFQRNESALNIGGTWNLPTSTSGNVLFPSFENLLNLINFRNALALPALDWFKLFDFAILNSVEAKTNLINALCNLSRLTTAAVEPLLGKESDVNDMGMLHYAFPADFLNGASLLTAINCANRANLLGSSSANIAKLIIPIPTPAQENDAAELAKSLLKSKFDVPTWLNIIQPISNQLRLKKRDALTSYILTSPEAGIAKFRHDNVITDINSLYAYYLIDLEMDACMLTSRIKQAIGSTQLFVDRCLMNLETGIVLSNDFTTQWNTWRKRYRVWEANRKIFLYPENWIEPDLRDDKSPFFKELESKLKQNEITDETAEDALRNYLEKLDAVANLEMVGVYPDNLTGIVHVIGRTRNIPHQYYYAKQVNSVWSAWEKVNLDIEGDNILLVVWNNRLMLFWGMFAEKEQQDPGGFNVPSAPGNIPPAQKYLEMKLAWSEYKNGKWIGKKISSDVFSTLPFLLGTFNLTKAHISLSSFIDSEKLFVRLFVPFRTDIPVDIIVNIGGFAFDGCHNSPSSYSLDPASNFWNGFIKLHDTDLHGMIIQESNRKDVFSLFDSGIYKKILPSDGYKETTLFNNTPGVFNLLPNNHEIEKTKPTTFFYNNGNNNFYVHSIGGFTKHPFPFDDVSVVTQGVLVNRKPVDLFPVLNLQMENSQAVTASIVSPAIVSTDLRIIPGSISIGPKVFPPVFFGKHYVFLTFYHPYVCELIKTLNTSGIEGLYKNLVPDIDGKSKDGIQNKIASEIFIPNGAYNPTNLVNRPYPVEQVDFTYSAMYSIYNWELFFHIPLLIATRLSQNQKFDHARKWFHYIFDPTRSLSLDITGAERFWITKPFKEEIRKGVLSIEDLLNNGGSELDLQLKTWEQNPFNPHAVARLRISAYMRSTLKKYIDNLIAWGDQLFKQDTLETINEATLLYVLAANMLGKKPDRVPPRAIPKENSYSTIQDNLDSFSNAKVAIQSYFSMSDVNSDTSISNVMMPLFCIPKNEMLLGYWDTVADRLFKIRHCLNIEGVFQQLPLFEPPIDPALLVRAQAAGLDLSSVLNDLNVPLPNYRFQAVLQKANEICSDVKGLGGELLAALEKKDAEQLALLRSTHEINLLQAVRDIKLSQIDEANKNLDSLNKSKDVIQKKRDYYASRDFINVSEAVYFASIPTAMVFQNMQIGSQTLAAILHSVPDVTIGPPFASGGTYGGANLGNAANAAAAEFGETANLFNTIGTMANLLGSYQRRQDEWNFQSHSADLELKQIDKQIAAAEIRFAIAEKDLENHDLQIEQSKEVDDFLGGKYTNEELYDYMVGQISAVYFQSYQLAFNTSKRAEKCFQHELGVENTSFISFGYWDNLKKGLLSGERLQYDLRRLEAAYLEQNRREYELTKHVSLAQLDPVALLKLRQNGDCFVDIPETVFDMDYPGHYFRRLRTVGLSIPCVAGPFITIACTLTLTSNHLRKDNTLIGGKYERDTVNQDTRFRDNIAAIQSITTSGAQNDHGIFELNFRDERYLPFEGAGAISSWQIKLNKNFPQFDSSTITDVIMHLNYTAREGGDLLKSKAVEEFNSKMNGLALAENKKGLFRVYDLKREYSDKWYKFLHPSNATDDQQLVLDDLSDRLPFFTKQFRTKKVKRIEVVALAKNANDKFKVQLSPLGTAATNLLPLIQDSTYQGLHRALKDLTGNEIDLSSWTMKIQADGGTGFKSLPSDSIDELFLIINYAIG